MLAIKLKLLLLYMVHDGLIQSIQALKTFLNLIKYLATTAGTRRIKDGVPVETPKKYVASYQLKYGELDYWSLIDIALVRVETPFDFNDATYEQLCSYKPTPIAINYEEKYQEPGTDALVLGWGHIDKWRKNKDKKDHNQELLRYAPTLLLNKTTCKEHYEDYANMSYVIETYMICTLGKGNIDDGGNTIVTSLPIQNGCTKEQAKVLGFEGVSCEEEEYEDGDETRRQLDGKDGLNQTYIDNMAGGFNESIDWKWLETGRRSGICQSPSVTYKVQILRKPLIAKKVFVQQRDLCDRPSYEKGYETVERHIRWKDNPPVRTVYNGRIVRSSSDAKSDLNEAHTSFISSENNQETAPGKHPLNKMYFNIYNPLRASAQKTEKPVEENTQHQENKKGVANNASNINESHLALLTIASVPINDENGMPENVRLQGDHTKQQNVKVNYMPSQNERILLSYGKNTNNGFPYNNGMSINTGITGYSQIGGNNGKPASNGMGINNGISGNHEMHVNSRIIANKNGMQINNGILRNNGIQGNKGIPVDNIISENNGMHYLHNNHMPRINVMQMNNGMPENTRPNRMLKNYQSQGNYRFPVNYNLPKNNGAQRNIQSEVNNFGLVANNKMTKNNKFPLISESIANYKALVTDRAAKVAANADQIS
ncbi:hypothetical protein HF086_017671 [Spodoptera exigua]|uniref:Peptidase S1 domain-containing protein n=1 Tax=Spodoptera exigua TaxID=7107 RepID=A0A922MFY9_SPOEX|nr:hypothetical protein HF086_017671 [Spodoptera exigua]